MMKRQQQNSLRQSAARPISQKPVVDAGAATAAKDAGGPPARRQRHRRETRAQLLERLLNPQISLHEASILLRVCPATVRNYTKSGLLPHVRTPGRQRRFYLKDVLALLRQLDGARK
ncbi:MAG TPA: helix-turn-helix domain-containing protein [Abditibacteriaceae bacterium]|nr:helix-turn-helix domain-containing protein [Abditibacteriaceae bacterium]